MLDAEFSSSLPLDGGHANFYRKLYPPFFCFLLGFDTIFLFILCYLDTQLILSLILFVHCLHHTTLSCLTHPCFPLSSELYTPPFARKQEPSGQSYVPSSSGPGGSGTGRGFGALREAPSGGFNRSRGGFSGGPGGDQGYSRGGYGGFGGQGGYRGGYGNRGRFVPPTVNELGFHGKLEEDKHLEKQLFENPRQSTGMYNHFLICFDLSLTFNVYCRY